MIWFELGSNILSGQQLYYIQKMLNMILVLISDRFDNACHYFGVHVQFAGDGQDHGGSEQFRLLTRWQHCICTRVSSQSSQGSFSTSEQVSTLFPSSSLNKYFKFSCLMLAFRYWFVKTIMI